MFCRRHMHCLECCRLVVGWNICSHSVLLVKSPASKLCARIYIWRFERNFCAWFLDCIHESTAQLALHCSSCDSWYKVVKVAHWWGWEQLWGIVWWSMYQSEGRAYHGHFYKKQEKQILDLTKKDKIYTVMLCRYQHWDFYKKPEKQILDLTKKDKIYTVMLCRYQHSLFSVVHVGCWPLLQELSD